MTFFRKVAKISLVLVYVVIVAGAVVRMTGSGMGCPDWPKCFGYYIPPTNVEELQWQPNRQFKKGQVIILGETLRVAKSNFTTALEYSADNWEEYTKHDLLEDVFTANSSLSRFATDSIQSDYVDIKLSATSFFFFEPFLHLTKPVCVSSARVLL